MKKIYVLIIQIFLLSSVLNTVKAQEYKETESKGNIANGLKEGRWIDVTKDGVIYKEYFYEKGKPVGIWKFFYPNGKIRYENEIANDKVIRFKIFKLNNEKIEIIYDEGFSKAQHLSLLDFEEDYYKNQLIIQKLQTNNDAWIVPQYKESWHDKLKSIINGFNIKAKIIIYYPDGKVRSEITFEKDRNFSQIDYYYDKQNQVSREEYIKNGKPIKYIKYKKGIVVKEKAYKN